MERQKPQEEFYYAAPEEMNYEDSQAHRLGALPAAGHLGQNALKLVKAEALQGHEGGLDLSILHDRILSASHFPPADAINGLQPVAVDIISDHSLRVGSDNIKLGGRQLFFFNSLMLLRDAPRSAEELMDLGFSGSRGAKDLNSSAKLFIERFNLAAGAELIAYGQNDSKKGEYRVSQSLSINDLRDVPSPASINKRFKKFKKSTSQLIPNLKPVPLYERAIYSSLMERGEAIKNIVRSHADHPRINELLSITENNVVEAREDTKIMDSKSRRRRRKHRMLKPDELSELFKRIDFGVSVYKELEGKEPSTKELAALVELTAAYNVIYASNLGLVIDLTNKIISQNSDPFFEDMFQEGSIGLGEAIRRYDYQKGASFSTYATWWIKNSLNRGYDATARPVRIPSHQTLRWLQYKDTYSRAEAELGREPTTEEMMRATGFSTEEIFELTNFGPRHLLSLDAPLIDAPKKNYGDTVAVYDKEGHYAEPGVYRPALHPEMAGLMSDAGLTARRKLMLSLRYGFYVSDLEGTTLNYRSHQFKYEEFMDALHASGAELSNSEVAEILDMKEESVDDGVSRGIKKIQKVIGNRVLSYANLPVRP